jgi:hypothetical protein
MRFVRRVAGRTPRSVRRVLLTVAGVAAILLGVVLVVLPGPFTIPPVLAGLWLLSHEYAWAARLLEAGRRRWQRVRRPRRP